MADEKVQELSLEDLESVGGGVIVDRPKKKSSVDATDEDSNLRVADMRGDSSSHTII